MAGLSTYAPDFSVRINDAEMPMALRACVTHVRYEDGVPSMMTEKDRDASKAADRVEIEFANPESAVAARAHSRPRVQAIPHGRQARTRPPARRAGRQRVRSRQHAQPQGRLSRPARASTCSSGEVTGVQADFPATGVPTMTLVAHDFMQRLGEGQHRARLQHPARLRDRRDPERGEPAAADDRSRRSSRSLTATGILNAIFKGSGPQATRARATSICCARSRHLRRRLLGGRSAVRSVDPGLRGRTLYLSRFCSRNTRRG